MLDRPRFRYRVRPPVVTMALTLALLVFAASEATASRQVESPTLDTPLAGVAVIAHRGASYDNPEHTFAAYDAAMAADVDFLECDLQLTADRVLVCVHDTTVDRTSDGTGRVDSFALDHLRQLDFGSWFNERNPARAKQDFAGLAIVPLEEQLDCYLGHNPRMRFHLETKAPSEYAGEMEPALVAVLERKGLVPEGDRADAATSRVVVQSFDLESLMATKELAPSLPTAFLSSGPAPAALPDFVDIAAPNYLALLADPTYIDVVHAQGKQVHTWTVDDPDTMDSLLDAGIDGVFSNRPDILRERVDAKGLGVSAAARGNPAPHEFVRGCPGVAGTVVAPPAEEVPEAPRAILLPLIGTVIGGVAVGLRRRDRRRRAAIG